jgi:hypothetical protein
MSADVICDKELAALIKRAAAALDDPQAAEDRPGLVSALDRTAHLLDARRDRPLNERRGSASAQGERAFLTRLSIALFWTFVANPAVWLFIYVYH